MAADDDRDLAKQDGRETTEKKLPKLTTVNIVIGPPLHGKKQVSLQDPTQKVVHMSLNDTIQWNAPGRQEAFWIVFEDRTPFDKHAFSTPDVGYEWKPLQLGVFKYHIVLHDDRYSRLDPVIIIDPPPYP